MIEGKGAALSCGGAEAGDALAAFRCSARMGSTFPKVFRPLREGGMR